MCDLFGLDAGGTAAARRVRILSLATTVESDCQIGALLCSKLVELCLCTGCSDNRGIERSTDCGRIEGIGLERAPRVSQFAPEFCSVATLLFQLTLLFGKIGVETLACTGSCSQICLASGCLTAFLGTRWRATWGS